MVELSCKTDRLLARMTQLKSCVVAYSGGVDSAVVARAAVTALGDHAVAATAVSASLARGEREAAAELAKRIGIRHVEVMTDEMANPLYVANQADRCFHCKTELYHQLQPLLLRLAAECVVNGANLDDLDDYRPGMQAARNFRVLSPLAECEFSKEDVRALARKWELPVADKPATPCLASRVAYGEEVTPARLRMIDSAEQTLKAAGLGDVRVRYHRGDLARLEVSMEHLPRITQEPFCSQLTQKLGQLGFKYITLDLQGRRSGSQNLVLQIEQPSKF